MRHMAAVLRESGATGEMSQMRGDRERHSGLGRLRSLWVNGLLVVGTALGLWLYGGSYYRLPIDQRVDSPLHVQLSSAQSVGHGLGVVGTAMLVLLLAYSLRKRVVWLQGVGTLRQWLAGHIFLGLLGPLLITFHSAFIVGGLVSIAYWSTMITALSGLFGRYIHIQLPRDAAGERLLPEELQEEERALDGQIRDLLGEEDLQLEEILSASPRIAAGEGNARLGISGLLRQDIDRLVARRRLHRLLRTRTRLPWRRRRLVVGLALRRAVLARRQISAASMEQLFRYWHVLHRPFVWILFIIAAVHVGVALLFGYTWL